MRSHDKKILLVLVVAVISTAIQQYLVPYVAPTKVDQVFVSSVCIGVWMVMNFIAIAWCMLALLFWQIVKLRSRYRDAKKRYSYGNPVKFPAFFRFMKWLNTDDTE